VGEGFGIAAIRLDPPPARGIHRRVVGGRHNDLMTQGLQALCHPCTLGRGLKQDARRRAPSKHGGEPLAVRLETLMQDLTGGGEGAHLALLFVHIDANIFQGWSPLSAASIALGIVER
jgi:hypothetical protein